MTAQLKNILNFTNVPVGGSSTLPHLLFDSLGQGLIPDDLTPSIAGVVSITADSTNVTVTNLSLASLNVQVLCESWHSIERAFGNNTTKHLTPQPFVAGQGGGVPEPGGGLAWISFRPFDPAGPHDDTFTDWNAMYAAVRELAKWTSVVVMFDTSFCPDYIQYVNSAQRARAFYVPPGRWDMRRVWWQGNSPFGATLVSFHEGAFVEYLEQIGGPLFQLVNNCIYTTPLIMGGQGPFGINRQGLTFYGARADITNTIRGCKPFFKQGGSASANTVGGTFSTFGAKQELGNNQLPSPLIDMGGFAYTSIASVENNCFTSLAGAIASTALSNLTVAAAPGDMVLFVTTTAGFPASGQLRVDNLNYGEVLSYSSVTATQFNLTTPVVGGYQGEATQPPNPSIQFGSVVSIPIVVNPGDTTIAVNTTTGFGSISPIGTFNPPRAMRVNGNLEVITYTGLTATAFLGCLNVSGGPILGNYPPGTLFEPVRALSVNAIPVGAGQTVTVDTTDGFPASGTLFLYQNGVSEAATYTGKTSTTFTGVTTTKAYGTNAIMEISGGTAPGAGSFVGGSLANHYMVSNHGSGRYATHEWQQPNLDLSTVTVTIANWPLSQFSTSTRLRHVVRTTTGNATPATTMTSAVAVDATTIPAVTTGYPSTGYLVIGDGSESVAYSGLVGGFSGCTPLIKAHANGTNIKYGASYSEVVLMDATAITPVVQLPTAKRSMGEIVTIKEAAGGAGGITVVPFTGETIDGAGSATIAGAFGAKTYVANGSGGWLSL